MNIQLTGLNGSEPLAFLAALGVVQGMRCVDPQARLSWSDDDAHVPTLQCASTQTRESLTEALAKLCAQSAESFAFNALGSDLKVAPKEFEKQLLALRNSGQEAETNALDFYVAFGSEIIADGSGKKLKPTALHMTAGQQQFLEMARDLLAHTRAAHLSAALFEPWRYDDPPPAMRWDTSSERLYALEARNPSGNAASTVRGANTLGILALPLFPVCAVFAGGRPRLRTRGFHRDAAGEAFIWPLWRSPLSPATISMLLADERLVTPAHESQSKAERRWRGLRAAGVLAIFRAERFVNDHGYGTLRPAERML